MAVHQPEKAWLPALGVLAVLLWSAQIAADWFVPRSDIGIAQLDKIELATVSHSERHDSSRVWRLESKPDPEACVAGLFAADDNRTDSGISSFVSENTRNVSTATLPGIRAPPQRFSA